MSTYDYTKDDRSEVDEYEIREFTPLDKSTDQIENENSFREIEPGEHLLVIQNITLEQPKPFACLLNGQQTSYIARSITVKFCLPDDQRANVQDYFVLPPENPDEHRAYNEGTPAGQKAKGFSATKFNHFAGRMGFLEEGTKQLNAAGRKLGGWKGRTIIGTIKKGEGTYENKKGEIKPSQNKLALFSYRAASEGAIKGPDSISQSASGAQSAARVDQPKAGAPFTPGPQGLAGSAGAQNRMAAVGLVDADDL